MDPLEPAARLAIRAYHSTGQRFIAVSRHNNGLLWYQSFGHFGEVKNWFDSRNSWTRVYKVYHAIADLLLSKDDESVEEKMKRVAIERARATNANYVGFLGEIAITTFSDYGKALVWLNDQNELAAVYFVAKHHPTASMYSNNKHSMERKAKVMAWVDSLKDGNYLVGAAQLADSGEAYYQINVWH